jgi:phosphomannomutase
MAEVFKAYDIRGVYPSDLNEALAERIGRALVEFLQAEQIVVGRDMRPHSEPLFQALAKGITEQGANVIDIGLCSTPMTYHANGILKSDGSVMITASHNPAEYNGFKICTADAVPISGVTGLMEIRQIAENKSWKKSTKKGVIETYNIKKDYAQFLKKHVNFNKKLKVVVDYANAMGSAEIEGIEELFDIIPLYKELDGTFPNHEANPLKLDTLDDLCAKVKETGADFGAGFDGDADRCGFVDNKGNIIPMDLFTAIIAQDILAKNSGTILYDLRSSRAVKECIEENGGTAIMSRVGHAFIKAQMRKTGAIFAGELSGHYYFRENFTAESQGLAMVMLANIICKTGKSASDLVKPLKKYSSSGEINSKVADINKILNRIKQIYSDGNIFELDGISVEYENWWFNVRASNTEPLLRLIVEADTKTFMEKKRDEILTIIRGQK